MSRTKHSKFTKNVKCECGNIEKVGGINKLKYEKDVDNLPKSAPIPKKCRNCW